MTDLRRDLARARASRPIARHGRLAHGGAAGRIVGLVASVLAVVLVATASVAGVAVYQVAADVTKPGVTLSHLNGATAPPSVDAIKGGVNLLLVGTDTRTGQNGPGDSTRDSSGAGNNDVTILMHIAEDHQSVTVVSFPRDLLITIPRCPAPNGGTYGSVSNAMLNTTLSRGGLACTVLTIENLTGVTIPYAAEISFDGVATLSNVVGGVTVCVASPINDPASGLKLPAGETTISGNTALAFVRTRHGVGDGSDLGRISNQQVFLSALTRKITSEGILKDPIKLYEIAKAAASNMTLSDSLSHLDTMVAIALALKSVPTSNIVMIQYPVSTAPSNPNRVVPTYSSAQLVNNALQKDERLQLTGTTGRGAVLAPGSSPSPAPTATTPPSGTASPDPNATGPASVALPNTVSGQTAAQQTCSKGNARPVG
ncbi:LCP family glycopolymer transferase [Pseudolysinimonas sp.]|uniref:LCP family protein n=1 Tax=Pseudolysinimonas sp. TaxID=2680009 RepID=UPI003F81C43F